MNEQTSNDDLLIQFVIQELGFHLQFIICASLVSCLPAKKFFIGWCGVVKGTTLHQIVLRIVFLLLLLNTH